MPIPLYTQTVVAFLWDFDRTLIPGNQQEALFSAYGVDEKAFWMEVDGLLEHYAARGIIVARDVAYLLHIISYVQAGVFKGLTNAKLRELGAHLEMAPGIPEFLGATKERVAADPRFSAEGITVEHYVVSSGIRLIIEGSPIAPYLDGIWANTFVERLAPPGYRERLDVDRSPSEVSHVGYMIDNTAKTRAIFEINKGVNLNPSWTSTPA
jgi:hypothetical protein